MYARLWWKDARQLWPIWVFLAVAAVVGQWLALRFWSSISQHTALVLLATVWASFYAIAAGAAAFAGEREAGTLRLLDIMPVERRVAWTGKVSFALGTTLILLGSLLAMAALGTKHGTSLSSAQLLPLRDVASLAVTVLEAMGWGLFWSAVLSSALSAAVVAIFCAGISWVLVLAHVDTAVAQLTDTQRQFAVWRFGIALCAVAASYIFFSRSGLPRRFRISLRSPIVVAWTGFQRPPAVRLKLDSPCTIGLPQTAQSDVSRAETVDTLALGMSRPTRPFWLLEARALAWQTEREGWKTWLLLMVIGLLGSIPVLVDAGSLDATFMIFADIGIALAAGVSVCGLENQAGTQRLLNHHAARPGLVWLVKLAVWCLGLAVIWGPQVIWVAAMLPRLVPPQREAILSVFLVAPIGFAVAQLCGMAIRRGITALIAATVLTAALAIPLLTGVFTLMVPAWGLLVFPVAFLFVSWAWSRDWLQSRPAPGRWLRLGLLFVGAMSILSVGYAGYRVLSVPNVSLVAPPESWIRAASAMPPAERNAADLYREAGRLLNSQYASHPAEYLKQNSEPLALIRRAAVRPKCQFEVLGRITPTNAFDSTLMGRLAELVMLNTGECQKNGNLGGAWDDILLLFQMARHCGEGAEMSRSLTAWGIEREALGLAMVWAIAPEQTPERLHRALTAYRALPKLLQATDVVRAEAHRTERTLRLPGDRLRGEVLSVGNTGEPWWPLWVEVITQPWEIARARRVNRVLAAAYLQTAERDPFQRFVLPSSEFSMSELHYDRQSTPLANLLISNLGPYIIEASDRNEVGRRALMQVLAIRAWQLRHSGQFPDRLDMLVPEELAALPDDPYTGRQFGYIRSQGQTLPPLCDVLHGWLSSWTGLVVRSRLFQQTEESWKPTRGYWLLYSVRPDLHDDHGRGNESYTSNAFGADSQVKYDLVFAIPPLESAPAK